MHRITMPTIMTAAALVAGCAGSVGYSATVSEDGYGPDLVYAAPGVQVIADYNEPIFYSDSFYWRFDGGTWYRSTYYTGGWAYATPPQQVLRIDRPRAYVHYRPQGWVARRDHREDRSLATRQPSRAPRPEPQRAAPPAPRAAPASPQPRQGRKDKRDQRK